MIRILSLSAIVFLFLLVCISPSMPLFGVFVLTFTVLGAVNFILWKRQRRSNQSISKLSMKSINESEEKLQKQEEKQSSQPYTETKDLLYNQVSNPLPSKKAFHTSKAPQKCFGQVLNNKSTVHSGFHS